MKGIPTLYNGVQFRSRLEARWAAFFDYLDLRWEYEPFDLDGWIPDFMLSGKNNVLVEIKPITKFDEATANKIFRASRQTEFRETDIFLGGCMVPALGSQHHIKLGWGHEGWSADRPRWDECHLVQIPNSVWGLFIKCGNAELLSGTEDYIFTPQYHEVRDLWRRAGNDVQWRAA